MPQEKLEAYQPNRAYKCGCICPTPATEEVKENICPACLVKENLKNK